jgi:hypothetical protein
VCIELPKNDGYVDAHREVRRASLAGTATAILKRLFA